MSSERSLGRHLRGVSKFLGLLVVYVLALSAGTIYRGIKRQVVRAWRGGGRLRRRSTTGYRPEH